MKHIAYKRPEDGGVTVVVPILGGRLVASFDDIFFDPPVRADEISRSTATLQEMADNSRIKWAETEDEWIARIQAKDVPPDALDVTVMDRDAIPSDRTFRDAWEISGSAVSVDMPKAREIHRDRLRKMRAPLMTALDVEYQRADEDTNDNGAAGSAAKLAKKAIAVRKQALRDVTADPAIDAAQTPEELKAVIPAALNP